MLFAVGLIIAVGLAIRWHHDDQERWKEETGWKEGDPEGTDGTVWVEEEEFEL